MTNAVVSYDIEKALTQSSLPIGLVERPVRPIAVGPLLTLSTRAGPVALARLESHSKRSLLRNSWGPDGQIAKGKVSA
jgi:hypothetical protein